MTLSAKDDNSARRSSHFLLPVHQIWILTEVKHIKCCLIGQSGSNPDVHQEMNGWAKCSPYIQRKIIQPKNKIWRQAPLLSPPLLPGILMFGLKGPWLWRLGKSKICKVGWQAGDLFFSWICSSRKAYRDSLSLLCSLSAGALQRLGMESSERSLHSPVWWFTLAVGWYLS